jgi:hypothetical protein
MKKPNRIWAQARRSKIPSVSGMAEAAATVSALAAMSLVVLVPAIFLLLPVSPKADGVTLCVPGIGPLQQFRDDLDEKQEEVVFIHEAAHAEQCRWLGAARYAKLYGSASGKLELEAEAFCAEIEVLSLRGAARDRLMDQAVETLMTGYFDDGQWTRSEVSTAVDLACGGSLAD